MAYRSGTYIAFHADGNNIPGKTDIDYYNLVRAWSAHPSDDFTFINSHDKACAVRDSGLKKTLRASLLERLRNSKNMLLIIGETTSRDTDWVPFEIEQAVDTYEIPIIAAYTMYTEPLLQPSIGSGYWPYALRARINNGTAHVIHVPLKKAPIQDAIGQFSHTNFPPGAGLGWFSPEAYRSWGMLR